MVAGRLREAVSDVAETLRRLFSEVPVRSLALGLGAPAGGRVLALAAEARTPALSPEARALRADLAFPSAVACPVLALEAALQREDGWDRWAAGAAVLEMPVFSLEGQRRLEVPPLPRRTDTRRLAVEPFRVTLRAHREPLRSPWVRAEAVRLPGLAVRRDLDRVLGLPVAVQGEDLQRLPKALWMRYTLQLVKATGENIRNLDVVGLYRVPSRGVRGLRHEGAGGRLLLELDREASGAPRVPMLLARRKEDRSLLTCFLEGDA